MRAVDGEYLKGLAIHVAHPARNVCGFSVPGIHDRISVRCESSLPCRELVEFPKWEP
jgi:hypothetical protein